MTLVILKPLVLRRKDLGELCECVAQFATQQIARLTRFLSMQCPIYLDTNFF
jgi:hypothetical protein